jgi:hypothetical protein
VVRQIVKDSILLEHWQCFHAFHIVYIFVIEIFEQMQDVVQLNVFRYLFSIEKYFMFGSLLVISSYKFKSKGLLKSIFFWYDLQINTKSTNFSIFEMLGKFSICDFES